MKVRVRLFAAAREAAGFDEVEVDLAAVRPTVAEVRRALAAGHPALGRVLATSRMAVDAAFAKDGDPVPQGAEVAVIPPVGGG